VAPQRHAAAIHAMLARHKLSGARVMKGQPRLSWRTPLDEFARPLEFRDLDRFVAGTDVFSSQFDGRTIADQYRREGISMTPANIDRVNGWAAILQRLGDPEAGIRPTLFIHNRCARWVECIANLQHNPGRPEDVLKSDADEGGIGGDDSADALRYLVATKSNRVYVRKLVGL
jgi:hypothetical protein